MPAGQLATQVPRYCTFSPVQVMQADPLAQVLHATGQAMQELLLK